ncbi:efflux RND transporter permease subunit [Zunongwangia profunda]|uniref:efflux RND transporter permease subunit n=2 Tax=Zunongwangia profunda TaxID=398743 RepID=UPI001D17D8C6|nr:efflux RND transporter permease subunit [Zunongwangia profunda]MCC4228594.1 efflux RND transporter permease subunit [Zunongwangia profunda]
MKLAAIPIKRPTIVVVLFTILILGGLYSYSRLGYELLPKFSLNLITISTPYPGASSSEVENSVTKKIEDAISSVENVKKIESKSFEGLSTVSLTLTSDADENESLNDAQRKINAIEKDLPDDVDPPSLSKFSLSDLPIITIGATANMEETAFYDLLDKKIKPVLSSTKGVGQITVIGGSEREIQVNIDPEKVKGFNLTLPQVVSIILSSNIDYPTGNLKTRHNRVLIRLSGKYENVEELRNLVVSSTDGIQVRVRDIAEVRDTQQEVTKIARVNGKDAIIMQVMKQSDANAVEVSKAIYRSLQEMEAQYAGNQVKLPVVDDSSEFTLQASDAVMHDLILAVVLVAVVMLFFLHTIRNAFIVMVSIPASLIATFIGMYLLGYTLNLMSLLGLSLVVGILVDDAIVVLENIYRHMEMGKNRVQAAYDGMIEIGFTVSAITLVIVVVFLPIAMSTGLVSDLISQFCVTVILATLFSLLSSFTIVPWLSSRFGKLGKITGKNFFERIILSFEKGLDKFTHFVSGLLKWSLVHKGKTTLIVMVLFIGSCSLLVMGFIGGEFLPPVDRGQFVVQLELNKDASLETTNLATQKAEKILSQHPEVNRLVTTVGQSSDGTVGTQETPFKSEITVALVDKAKRKDKTTVFAAQVKRELQQALVGVKIKTATVSIVGGADDAPISLTITAPNYADALEFSKKALDSLAKVPGATQIKSSAEKGNPEVQVSIDRDKMAALGIGLQDVGMAMQTAFNGNTDGKFRSGAYEYDINIKYNAGHRLSIQDVRDISFVNAEGKRVQLSQFSTITEGTGPSFLERRDKSAAVTISAQAAGRPSGDIAANWEEAFAKIPRENGVSYIWGGDMENQSDSFGTLLVALLAAIILVYLILVVLYDSYLYPLVVLFSIPLSFIGALWALALTNNALNIFTILGIIMLIGLVAKNAILLVDFTNHQKAEGLDTFTALVNANHARLRPILMTTIAMVIGMIPIALASGAGAELNNGLAWVIIGGLISSLLLTLIVVPVVYSAFDKLAIKFKGKNHNAEAINNLVTSKN